MDENMITMVENVKELIGVLMTKIEASEARVAELENTLYNQLLVPIKASYDAAEYDDRLNTFRETYGDKLGPYADQLKAVEGEDFDFAKNTFDEYEASDKEMPEGEYVDAVIEKVAAQLETIKEKLNSAGIPAETVEATVTDEGVEVEAKDENGETVATEETIEEVTENGDEIIEDTEEVSDEDDLAAFEDELNAEMDKYK